jgi:Ni/Co efflux regulator RcnB
MNRTKIMAAAAALLMGVATVASAQHREDDHGGPGGPGGPGGGHMMERGRAGPDRGGPRPGFDRGPGGGPEHAWHRGDRLPSDYRGRQYVVDDWRAHRLNPPPRGYQWVSAGADYALVAVATGIIASLIVNGQQ